MILPYKSEVEQAIRDRDDDWMRGMIQQLSEEISGLRESKRDLEIAAAALRSSLFDVLRFGTPLKDSNGSIVPKTIMSAANKAVCGEAGQAFLAEMEELREDSRILNLIVEYDMLVYQHTDKIRDDEKTGWKVCSHEPGLDQNLYHPTLKEAVLACAKRMAEKEGEEGA